MRLRLAGRMIGVSLALAASTWASSVWADPEVLLKCDGAIPQGLRYTQSGGWQPFANPDRAVTITREKGKLSITFDGERSYTTRLVFAVPESGVKTFRVLGQSGVERFEVYANVTTGKPAVRHASGGSDIRITALANCAVVSPDVAVRKLEDLDQSGKH